MQTCDTHCRRCYISTFMHMDELNCYQHRMYNVKDLFIIGSTFSTIYSFQNYEQHSKLLKHEKSSILRYEGFLINYGDRRVGNPTCLL